MAERALTIAGEVSIVNTLSWKSNFSNTSIMRD